MDPIAAIRKLFGERVRYFRELRGWQLDDVGSRLGKSRASMSRIENGKQNLTMIDIAAIGQALEVPVDELFRTEGQAGRKPLPDERQAAASRCLKEGKQLLYALTAKYQQLDQLVAS